MSLRLWTKRATSSQATDVHPAVTLAGFGLLLVAVFAVGLTLGTLVGPL